MCGKIMKILIVTALACILSVTCVQGAGCKRRVCYYTNWSQYRPGQFKFKPHNIDASLCTHMIYDFAKVVNNKLKSLEWNDESTSWSVGLYEEFSNLKKNNPDLKTLLGVGGWAVGSKQFPLLALGGIPGRTFVASAIKFLRNRDFDGLEIAWEYPGNHGNPPEYKHFFTGFLQSIQKAFEDEAELTGKPRLLLSAAVAAKKSIIDTAYEIPEISKHLDFINLMTYDLHGVWEKSSGHMAPLYSKADEIGSQLYLNIDWVANYWVQKGAPKSKINVGFSLHGSSFTLQNPSHNLPGDPAIGPGKAGNYTKTKGLLSYYEICAMKKAGGQVHVIQNEKVPYIVKGDQWVGYDDPTSIRSKVAYVKNNNFGGVVAWSLDMDDFQGVCGQGKYPLMHAINNECSSG